jgi:hypothetical protein
VATSLSRRHSGLNRTLVGWPMVYKAHPPGVEKRDSRPILFTPDLDEVQPDETLFLSFGRNLAAKSATDDDLAGVLEPVVEISASSVACDLRATREICKQAGVRE